MHKVKCERIETDLRFSSISTVHKNTINKLLNGIFLFVSSIQKRRIKSVFHVNRYSTTM